MKPLIRLTLTIFALALPGCGTPVTPSLPSADGVDLAALSQSRSHATFVSFTKWHDTMQIDVGLAREGEHCKMLTPLVTDDTTRWKPFQIYWAIRDDASNVKLGTKIRDTFFLGDLSTVSEFPGVLGFAALDSQYAHLLALEGITTSADGSTVDATIGSPFNAKIRLEAVANGEDCTTQTSYCKTSGSCTAAAQFRPLTSILVKQNFFGFPSEVIYY